MEKRRDIKKYLIWGISLRLFFSPFTSSTDLLWPYHRGFLLLKGNYSPGITFFADYLHGLFLVMLKPLLGSKFLNMWNIPWGPTHPTTSLEVSSMLHTFFAFISQPGIFWILFLLKLPYLFFDLGCAFLLLRIKGENSFRFWMLNPVIIFITSIYGRYEVIPIFFILLGIYLWLKKGFREIGFFTIGIASLIRLYPLILFPFLIVGDKDKPKRIFTSILAGILPLLPFFFIPKSEGITSLPHLNYLLSMNFFLGFHSTIYIFVLGYFLLLFKSFYSNNRENIVFYLVILHLLLFSTCYFHLQFYAWLIPFLSLIISGRRDIEKFFYFSLIFYFLYIFQWGKVNSVFLFAPLNPSKIISIPSLQELLSPETFHKFMGIVRTGLSASLIWIMFLIVKKQSKEQFEP